MEIIFRRDKCVRIQGRKGLRRGRYKKEKWMQKRKGLQGGWKKRKFPLRSFRSGRERKGIQMRKRFLRGKVLEFDGAKEERTIRRKKCKWGREYTERKET
jgi:hypothetical protein